MLTLTYLFNGTLTKSVSCVRRYVFPDEQEHNRKTEDGVRQVIHTAPREYEFDKHERRYVHLKNSTPELEKCLSEQSVFFKLPAVQMKNNKVALSVRSSKTKPGEDCHEHVRYARFIQGAARAQIRKPHA